MTLPLAFPIKSLFKTHSAAVIAQAGRENLYNYTNRLAGLKVRVFGMRRMIPGASVPISSVSSISLAPHVSLSPSAPLLKNKWWTLIRAMYFVLWIHVKGAKDML
jgi:hypothetical protein